MPGWSLRWSTLEAGELYREDLVGLDLATGAERWQLGGGWRAGRTKFSDERSGDWTQGWAVGLLVRPVERLALGAAWEDRSGIDAPTARLAAPWIYRFGATVAPADSLWATHVGAEGLQEGPLGWSIGQEARWRILVFRAGLRVDPWVLSFGAGVRYGNLVVDWSRQGDPRTGWQHLWTISVAW